MDAAQPALLDHRGDPVADGKPVKLQEARGIVVTDGGIVTLPTGPHKGLTRSLAKLLARSKDHQRREDFRFYRRFLEFAGSCPSDPLAFLRVSGIPEDYERGVKLVKAALEDVGFKVEHQVNLSNNYEVTLSGKFPNYLGRYPRRIRVLFAQLIEDELYRDKANPAEVPDWHMESRGRRLEYAKATIHNKYGWRFAGARFVVSGRQLHEGRPQNPAGMAGKMTDAVLSSSAPEVIKILTQVYSDEAPRLFELLPATALGWHIGELGSTIYVRNKFGSNRPDKAVVVTAAVQDYLLRRFNSLPHPECATKTMMDYIHELSLAGDEEALDQIALFVSEKTKGSYSKSGFRYWFQDAMLTAGVKVDGWVPSPHFFRNCRMNDTITHIFAQTQPGQERTRRLNKAGKEFGHESSSWKSYVQFAWKAESRRQRRAEAEKRQCEAAARRAGVASPPRSPRLRDPVAAAQHAALPSRPLR